MSAARRLRRTPVALLVLLALDVGGAHALDRLGLVEALLSPGGARTALVLPLAVAFYAARFLLLFLMPGLVLARIAHFLVERRRRTG